jgi:hypothetical protein
MTQSLRSSDFFTKFLPLAALMLATRYFHIGSAWHLPDASWAVFFLGGFYLRRALFPLLVAETVAIDFIFFALGGSAYCLSPGYWFLLPTYAALWFGGEMLNKIAERNVRFFALAIAYWWVAASLAYFISNASFYWLSDKAVDPSWSHYIEHAQIWYAAFVSRPMMYLLAAALLHFAIVQAQRLRMAVS